MRAPIKAARSHQVVNTPLQHSMSSNNASASINTIDTIVLPRWRSNRPRTACVAPGPVHVGVKLAFAASHPCRSSMCCWILVCMTLRDFGRPSSRLIEISVANSPSARYPGPVDNHVSNQNECNAELVRALSPRISATHNARSTGAICRTRHERTSTSLRTQSSLWMYLCI